MKVKLITDAPKHNLALMKISTYHKLLGDKVYFNEPINADLTYGSWLFNRNYYADYNGGPATEPNIRLPEDIENLKPDYSLFPVDYSLGYTWAYCPNKCGFCVVPKQNNSKKHQSIWEFHDQRFKKICLLNNNTFSDPQWRETFEEIWEANLIIHDENGYDLRLLTEEKAESLKHTRFEKEIHFSWDFIEDENKVIRGMELVKRYKINACVFVLIGYPDMRPIDETDIYRCQKIADYGFSIFPMPYNGGFREHRAFKRFIRLFAYKNYKTVAEGWCNYSPSKRGHKNQNIKSQSVMNFEKPSPGPGGIHLMLQDMQGLL